MFDAFEVNGDLVYDRLFDEVAGRQHHPGSRDDPDDMLELEVTDDERGRILRAT